MLLQLLARLVVFTRALVDRRLQELAANLLDDGATVGVEEDDYGVELCVVELVHGAGCDVQQAVLTLGGFKVSNSK